MYQQRILLRAAIAAAAFFTGAVEVAGATELRGRAVLPAETFARGPTSGQYIGAGPIHGIEVPFLDRQPVQGFSAMLRNADGSWWMMSDNGYGAIDNSADYNLRVYRTRVNTAGPRAAGQGEFRVLGFIELHDPERKVTFPITNEFSQQRILTGADFDIESMQRAPDGTFWFGEEFGPFLLHTDATGKVLEAPSPLPDFTNPGQFVRAPQNPYNEEGATVRLMNAFRSHAQQLNGASYTPVFSPDNNLLAYPAQTAAPGVPALAASDPNRHYARGTNSPADLVNARSDIFPVPVLRRAGYPIVPYTVNDTTRMQQLLDLRVNINGVNSPGVNGIITDSPDVLLGLLRTYDFDGDGSGGDLLTNGLPDVTKLDLQGHRGARNLRPENTLPAMEAGLDNLVTTLETDIGVTLDGVAIHMHDPYINPANCRRADGAPYSVDNQVLIRSMTVAQIQSTFICDNLRASRPTQTNDRTLSPVAVAFAAQNGLFDPYVMPTTQQLFDFVRFYQSWYQSGPGSADPNAEQRWKTAAKARFNIETKINPRSDIDEFGQNIFRDRTVGPEVMTRALAGAIVRNGLQSRVDIQSFDFRTLLVAQREYPRIRTIYLFGDFPIITDPARLADSSDSTNLQDENGANTPWLAGLSWPYRVTSVTAPFRAQSSGGFEGMAMSPDGKKLYPLLERPLTGDPTDTLEIHEFDIASRSYTGNRWFYPLSSPLGSNIGDFQLHNDTQGLVLERDGSQGSLTGFKRVFEVTLGTPVQAVPGVPNVTKADLVDLINIADPLGLSLPGLPGDIGLGNPFAFPFVTIEDVWVLSPYEIAVLNDNNFPFSVGRHVGSDRPDDNEFIVLRLDRPLSVARPRR